MIISKQDVKNKCYNIFMKIVIILFLVFVLVVHMIFGGFSKLKYTNMFNLVNCFHTISCELEFENDYPNSYLVEDEIRIAAKKYAKEISQYIFYEYDIKISVPEFEIYVCPNINYAFSGYTNDDRIVIGIPENYLNIDDNKLWSSLIHEIFHVFSFKLGKNAYIYDTEGSRSIIYEGFTEILTDEFIEYKSYTFNKRCENTGYKYYVCLLKCMFTQGGKEEFANFYFLGDTTIVELFNNKVRKNANLSCLFNPYSKFEESLNYLYSNNIYNDQKTIECFYSSLELMLYYCYDGDTQQKKICIEYVEEIFEYANQFYLDCSGDKYIQNYEYLMSLLKV